jgi:hypothetical protein
VCMTIQRTMYAAHRGRARAMASPGLSSGSPAAAPAGCGPCLCHRAWLSAAGLVMAVLPLPVDTLTASGVAAGAILTSRQARLHATWLHGRYVLRGRTCSSSRQRILGAAAAEQPWSGRLLQGAARRRRMEDGGVLGGGRLQVVRQQLPALRGNADPELDSRGL